MSPGYSPYTQQHQPPFSPYPAHVYPAAPAYPPPFAHQHHSPGGQQDGEGGTWWYVPSQPQPQQPQPQQPSYETPAVASSYPFYPPSPHPDSPAHGPQHVSYPASPTYARASTPSSSSVSAHSPAQGPQGRDKPLVRRAYHPNPPAHRSEWVMWAGNVPSDAGHDELWRFFTQAASSASSTASTSSSAATSSTGSAEAESGTAGVLSIFLISRSSCAFVNYDTEPALLAAIARFNGVPLRPADPRCARLVCRVRRKDDDLRAGVGGQRGMGMHTRWVKERERGGKGGDATSASGSSGRERGESESEVGSSSESAASRMSALSLSDDDPPARPPPRPHTQGSASSGSHASASTNSSLLARHFPQRFFILKSLTRQDDLDLSVRSGLWATQRHNEGVLDRAFRTAQDVFLVFSVNKSGEFYGYARMEGPVGQADGNARVAWATRSSASSGGPLASPTGRTQPVATTSFPVPHGDASAVHGTPAAQLLSDSRVVDHSPAAFPSATSTPLRPPDVQSAPAVLGKPHRAMSGVTPPLKHSLDERMAPSSSRGAATIELDDAAPFRAMRGGNESGAGLGRVAEEPGDAREDGPVVHGPIGRGDKEKGEGAGEREESWGQDFKLQWLCTERLPFTRTRHIRNPWNHDREVKVSRDGTELEPGVGQALLEEWRAYLASEGAALHTPISEKAPSRGGGSGGGGTSRS
ncbi:YT521-B-like domain-containing protein [Mycena galericulata]|nr:YT521-B-like domain-containing protein [Mycena galericulata]